MIVIPAAGLGQRFQDAGYEGPKHLLPLAGRPMVEWVTDNLRELDPGPVQVLTREVVGATRGTAETLARAQVPRDEPLLVGNCDQLLAFPPDPLKDALFCDGIVFWFRSCSPAHSYLTVAQGCIVGIREKEVVSHRAVSGVYWFRRAGMILDACQAVCEGEGELYLSRALALLLRQGADLRAVEAPTAILGTPEDYARFEVALALTPLGVKR